jgi:acetyltransferase-like isoleucine patch superfamily enzyme
MKTMVILGACGTSREAWWILQETMPETRAVFVEDVSDICQMIFPDKVVPVIKDWDFSEVRNTIGGGDKNTFKEFICGMGSSRAKKIMVDKARAAGLHPARTVVSNDACVRPDVTIGLGGIIHNDCVLTTNIILGDFVTVHLSRAGHDVVMEDYVTLSPGCHIGGHAKLCEGVFLGACTVVQPRVIIAPWVCTGINTAVIKSIESPGITVAGVPAKELVPRKSDVQL